MAPKKRRRNPAIEDRPCRGCTILSNHDVARDFVERLHPLRHSLGAFNVAARELQSDVQYAPMKVRHNPEDFENLADRTCRNTLTVTLQHPDDDREIQLRYCRFQNKNAMGGPCQRFVHVYSMAEGRHVCASHSTRGLRPTASSAKPPEDMPFEPCPRKERCIAPRAGPATAAAAPQPAWWPPEPVAGTASQTRLLEASDEGGGVGDGSDCDIGLGIALSLSDLYELRQSPLQARDRDGGSQSDSSSATATACGEVTEADEESGALAGEEGPVCPIYDMAGRRVCFCSQCAGSFGAQCGLT